jgi:hypothetical protein
MANGDEQAKVPIWATVVALLWLIFLSVICLAMLTAIWPHPTPAGISPETTEQSGTAPPKTSATATSTTGTSAPASSSPGSAAATTSSVTGATSSTPVTTSAGAPPLKTQGSEGPKSGQYHPCDDREFKPECDCLRRVAVMQGIYYGSGDKTPQMKNDPACVYLWVPFNLFGLSGWHVLWAETRLLLIVMLCGFLGAMIYSLRSFFWYTGNQGLVWSWMPMYILTPVIGSMMAVVFYLVLRGGLFNPSTSVSDTSPFGFAAIATLVGMFIQSAALKLKKVFEALFTEAEHGKDTVRAAPVHITVTPADPKHNTTPR